MNIYFCLDYLKNGDLMLESGVNVMLFFLVWVTTDCVHVHSNTTWAHRTENISQVMRREEKNAVLYKHILKVHISSDRCVPPAQ